MIENANVSKTASAESVKRYVGVATVHVVAVNPNNKTLRENGWNIPEDADEPQYVVETDGKKNTRVRFLVKVDDLINENVVIPLDFWIKGEYQANSDQTKFKIIDKYCRTAWGTKDEIKAKKIPEYASGPANIATPYSLCHIGEEQLALFLMKLLNVTPLQVFRDNAWVNTKNPGSLKFDDWNKLVNGNVKEIIDYVAMMPENRVKVILGVRMNPTNNKWYQTFIDSSFLGSNASADQTGNYPGAARAIARFNEGRKNAENYIFEPVFVHEWSENPAPTEVDETPNENILDFGENNFDSDIDDLPMGF